MTWPFTICLDDPIRGWLWGHECSLTATGTQDGKRIGLTARLHEPPLLDGFPEDLADFYGAIARPGACLVGYIDQDGQRWAGELALGTSWRLRLSGLSATKAADPIAEVIGPTVRLEKRGHEFAALCPFHELRAALRADPAGWPFPPKQVGKLAEIAAKQRALGLA